MLSWSNMTPEMIYTVIIIIYISMLSVYTPKSWLALINHPYIKFAILLYILYTFCIEEDIVFGVFLAVAFVITITIDNSIQAAKVVYENETKEKSIEHFANTTNKDDEDFTNDEEDQEEFETMTSNKNIHDTFHNLHESIHNLQKLIKTKQ
jgi:MFS superfamily sulfate permease-like transporter